MPGSSHGGEVQATRVCVVAEWAVAPPRDASSAALLAHAWQGGTIDAAEMKTALPLMGEDVPEAPGMARLLGPALGVARPQVRTTNDLGEWGAGAGPGTGRGGA